MFSGMVETVGSVQSAERQGDLLRLCIAAPAWTDTQPLGASISVSGACLTVVSSQTGQFTIELMSETLAKTKLGQLKVGDKVNLERAIAAGARLDGHIVQGHVDTVLRVKAIKKSADSSQITCSLPPDQQAYVIPQGSVCLDGVSLTVAALGRADFTVALIPYTMGHTTLGQIQVGDPLNMEADLIGKYVVRWMEIRGQGSGFRDQK